MTPSKSDAIRHVPVDVSIERSDDRVCAVLPLAQENLLLPKRS